MINKILVFIMVMTPSIMASDPSFYIKKDTWENTLWSSINMLAQQENSGNIESAMPDLGSSDFSIMAWINTSADNGVIFSKVHKESRPALQGKALYVEEGILKYRIESIKTFNSDYKINDGEWHHIIVTGKNPVKFFIDGDNIKSIDLSDSEKLNPDDITLNVRIGVGNWHFPFAGFVTFNGIIDEMKFYNRKLSSNEISTSYDNPSYVSNGLSGWWQFEEITEEGYDDFILDYSPMKNNGQPFNCKITEGKVGNGLQFSGRSGVGLSESASLTSRNKLWELLVRDFSSKKDLKEMELEQKDAIWSHNFSENGIKTIAGSYANKTRDFSGLKEQAVLLANSCDNIEGVKEVRNLYHMSISSQRIYSELMTKINSMEAAVAHLTEKYGNKYPEGSDYLNQIKSYKNQTDRLLDNPSDTGFAVELEESFKSFQYEALVTNNPLIDFDELVFTKRYTYNSSHYYTDFIDGTENPGGNISVLSLKDGNVKDLQPKMDKGIFGRYDLAFDGDKIVFDWKEKDGVGFRIFEMGIDGKDLKQITFPPEDEAERIARYDNSMYGGEARVYQHHTDDMHPCYLPDGGVCFTSTRPEYGVLCNGATKLTSSLLYRVDGDGQNMLQLTNSAVSEFSPAVMTDGRIMYSRWEYVDKGQIAVKCLWAMHPDGSSTVEVYGNDIPYPPVFIHGRPIPGTHNQFVFLGTPHYPRSGVGTVIRIDIDKPIRTHEPITYITPDVDIRNEGGFHHKVDGEWVQTDNGPLYMDPYPLSEKFYLVSHNPDKEWKNLRAYGLYLIDEFGNHVQIYQDEEYSSWQPMPLKKRVTPPVIPPVRQVKADQADEATVVMTDVYEGLDGVERGTIKYLRILEQVPRPWSSRRVWETDGGAPVISMFSVLGLKVLHGVVPVHDDGSAHFIVPANKNLYFEAIDENYMEIQRERTYVNYMPGETRTCIGCHTLRRLSPENKPVKALAMEPVRPHAQPGDASPKRSLHYMADVQPVLDKHCISCHNEDESAGDLILTGELTERFSVSYEQIIYKGLVVTANEGDDFKDTEPLAPKSLGSHASKLITTLVKGHYDVDLPIEDFVKLTTFVDANAQFYGSYYGRQKLEYADHPDFRPLHTFEQAVGPEPPYKEMDQINK